VTILELEGVSKRYEGGETAVEAVRDVSLSLEEGAFVALMGPRRYGTSLCRSKRGPLSR